MAAMYELGAAEAARRIRAGTLSPSNLLAACLKRTDAVEPAVAAWVRLDRDAAARVAVQRDIEAREGRFMGPLHGVPVALKDIFDAAGVPTTAGAPAWATRTPAVDAPSVAALRGAGAVPMGKLATTPFAYLDPSVTRNPWNPEHTPGGSSSGPAAAVAARMVPLALGSQTVGSVLRPAAYCGVVGLKPTHGRISVAGVLALAESLDHVGIFARCVEDCALALSLLAGLDPADPHSSPLPPEPYLAALAAPAPPRIGVLTGLVAQATPEMAKHLDAIMRGLEGAGARLVDVDLPDSFPALRRAGETVLAVEAAHAHAPLYAAHAADYPPRIKELIERGHAVSALQYLAAQDARRHARDDLNAVATRHDVLLAPTIGAPAPRGLGSTGDPGFCAPFTFAGLPAISLPTGADPSGLPLAVQLVAAAGGEAREAGRDAARTEGAGPGGARHRPGRPGPPDGRPCPPRAGGGTRPHPGDASAELSPRVRPCPRARLAAAPAHHPARGHQSDHRAHRDHALARARLREGRGGGGPADPVRRARGDPARPRARRIPRARRDRAHHAARGLRLRDPHRGHPDRVGGEPAGAPPHRRRHHRPVHSHREPRVVLAARLPIGDPGAAPLARPGDRHPQRHPPGAGRLHRRRRRGAHRRGAAARLGHRAFAPSRGDDPARGGAGRAQPHEPAHHRPPRPAVGARDHQPLRHRAHGQHRLRHRPAEPRPDPHRAGRRARLPHPGVAKPLGPGRRGHHRGRRLVGARDALRRSPPGSAFGPPRRRREGGAPLAPERAAPGGGPDHRGDLGLLDRAERLRRPPPDLARELRGSGRHRHPERAPLRGGAAADPGDAGPAAGRARGEPEPRRGRDGAAHPEPGARGARGALVRALHGRRGHR